MPCRRWTWYASPRRRTAAPAVADTTWQVEKFVEEECIPADAVYLGQLGETTRERFSARPAVIEVLKARAKELGLWNLFLPKAHCGEGAGFSNLEYGLMAEYLGKSRTASEVCRAGGTWIAPCERRQRDAAELIVRQATNCAAPDTGNMELLARYGNEEQKRRWLDPLLEGTMRSAFLMTEPQVASSDAANIEMSMRRDGDSYVLNGSVSPRRAPPPHPMPRLTRFPEMVVVRRRRSSLRNLHCAREDGPGRGRQA